MRIRGAHAARVLFSAAARKLGSVRSAIFQENPWGMPRLPKSFSARRRKVHAGRVCSPEVTRPRFRLPSYSLFDGDVLLKIFSSVLRITIVVVAVLVLLWWFGMRMPGRNVSK